MNAYANGKVHHHLQAALSGFKLPFRGRTRRLARLGTATRWLAPRKRFAALSPTATIMWRLVSHGTEPGKAHGLLIAWSGWEQLSHQLWPTIEIPAAPYHLLEFRIGCYNGESLTLPDGIKIDPGALVGELHCNNRNILDLVIRHRANPFAATREDLRSLAAWARQDEIGRRIQALYGVTMLTTGALRLGFTIRHQPVNIRRRFERVFMSGLLLLYTTEGVRRLTTGTTAHNYPQEVWISRRELIRRYGDRLAQPFESLHRPAQRPVSMM